MKLSTAKTLGLAFNDGGVACAAVSGGHLQHAARWAAGDGLSLDRPAEYGEALGRFLAENNLSGKAIVGLPARWLVAEPREVPPVGREQAAAFLRLQAERINLGDDRHLVFDAAGELGTSAQPGRAVLVGVRENQLKNIVAACEAAKVEVLAITSTGLTIATAMAEKEGAAERLLVVQSGGAAEVVWQCPNGPRALRHVAMPAKAGAASALVRAATTTGFTGDRIEIVGVGVTDAEGRDRLADAVGRSVELREPSSALGTVPAVASLNGESGRVVGEQLWPAVVLASTPASAVPINLLKPRLAPKPPPRVDRRWLWGAFITAAVVTLIGFLWYDASTKQAALDDLNAQLKVLEPEVDLATERSNRYAFGRRFFNEGRPPVLEAMSQLAGEFGYGDPIWTSRFTITDAGRATLEGRAQTQQAVLDLYNALSEHPQFTDVSLPNLSEARSTGRRNSDAGNAFTMTFTFDPSAPAPAPEEAAE